MIRLVQLLCSNRHCIIAAAYETASPLSKSAEEVRKMIRDRINELKINPWCEICGSSHWHFEDGATKFQNMGEALPVLRAAELENMLAREAVKRQRNQ